MTTCTRLFVAALAIVACIPLRAQTVPEFSKGRAFDARTGEALYRSICQGCHMPDGRGAEGAAVYPALAKNERLANAAYPIVTVLNGRRAMPPFAGMLDDAQVAAVVGYVRTHFDNRYDDAVTPAQAAALRPLRPSSP